MKSALPLFLVTLLCPLRVVPAQAVPGAWTYRVELFGDVGRGQLYNGDNSWGKGLDFGGGIGVRPFSGALRGLGFELRAARLSSDSASGVSSTTLASRFIAADAVYHFLARRRIQPYILGGVAVLNAHYSRSCSGCVFNIDPVTQELIPVPERWDTRASKVGVTFGGGLKIAVHRRISIRPEILLVNTTPGAGWNWAWVRAQVGVGWHF